MHFAGNEKNVNNTGLIYTTLEVINLDDLKKFAKSEEKNENDEICYLKYFRKNTKLNNLEKVLNDNIINNQIILTNFTENDKDIINAKHIYTNVVKNKTSYLMKNIYLSTFFTSDYINNICKEYKQVLINCDSKYHNKLYIDNNYIYLCVNDLTKLSLITHKNLYKDKHGLSNVVIIDLNTSVEDDDKNKSIDGQSDGTTIDYEKNKKQISPTFEKVNKTNENNNEDLESYKVYNIKYKMRNIYKNFFSELNTYPMNLVGTYDNCNNTPNFINKLSSIFIKNKSKDAKIYPIHLEYHETVYQGNSNDTQLNNNIYQQMNLNNSTINNDANANILNQLNAVTDIYKDIFSTSNLSNSLTTSFEYNMGSEIDKNANLSFSKIKKSNNFYYELDVEYIQNNIFSQWEKDKIINTKYNETDESSNSPSIRDDIYYAQKQLNHNTKMDINLSNDTNSNDDQAKDCAGKKESINNKMFCINDKTFYINRNLSDSSDGSLLEFCNIKREEGNSNEQNKNHIQKDGENNGILLNEERCQKSENAKYSDSRKLSINSQKKQCSELIEEYKNKKVNKILNFLRTHRENHFVDYEIFLKKKSLLEIMNYNAKKADLKNVTNLKMDEHNFDEFINYLAEYIGKIHLDIQIKFKNKSKIFLKEKQNKNQIQKIILNNGLINSSNIFSIFNFLLNQILKKDNIQNVNKLHYVMSMHGYEYNFVNYEKNFKEMSTQSSLHLFMFSSNGFLYLILLDTRNRIG
ncbi:conserved Plasmodium protein, unknown function [Plasmodium chabaudi chabaudi]|uniref:Uncharacterized protein n=1 Tax=Plasmodium chabaudi chabaudi TaxID=31271 RepID=A0A4V0K707_PLACU|nr:conserved Plasmodium protein, unknown function [Plasmodium chabaudi chabaudi]VTZ68692.1 conserved Plasmodium protein, unknown function [Plasmodium chabaudi chabaudi]|eukprot:XP_742331.2 conserved Plasmodium protein, unknown function [Plasmodium chabaudi chabaudi]